MAQTARTDYVRFLYLERQFCSICRSQGQPGVRVADTRRILEIGVPAFRRERSRLAKRHIAQVHPTLL